MSNIKKLDWYWRSGGAAAATLKIWIYNDAHIWRDKQNGGRLSFQLAMNHIKAVETYDFAWGGSDIFSRHNRTDHLTEVADILEQQIGEDMAKHYRYRGNVDCLNSNDPDAGLDVWNKYIDVLGNFPDDSGVINANRPFPLDYADDYVQSWKAGNCYFIQVSDYNNGPTSEGGRGTNVSENSYPIGSWRAADFLKVQELIFKNLDKNILLMNHHPIMDTTWVSSYVDIIPTESDPTIPGTGTSNYLTYIGTDRGPDNQGTRKPYLLFSQSTDSPLLVFWGHGHTHSKLRSTYGGKANFRNCFGFLNINTAELTLNTYASGHTPDPKSWFATINDTTLNLKQRVHHATNSESAPLGWYAPNELNVVLPNSYQLSYSEPTIAAPVAAPTNIVFSRVTANKIRVSWEGTADAYMVIRRASAAPTGSPTNDTAYVVGTTIGDGSVAFYGRNKYFEDYGLTASTTYHYKVIPLNGGGGSIKYGTSVLTGSQAVTQSNIYVYEEFRESVPNRYVFSLPMSNPNQAYFLHDDQRLKIYCNHSTNATIGTQVAPDNVMRAPNVITMGATTVCAIFDFEAIDFNVAGGNVLIRLGFYNTVESTPAKNRACYITMGYNGELALRAQTYRINNLEDNQLLSWDGSRTQIKILYIDATQTVTFHQWNGSSWNQIYSYVMAGNLGNSRNFRLGMGFEDSTGLTNGREAHIYGAYLTSNDISTIKP